jgi:hypothetical protein
VAKKRALSANGLLILCNIVSRQRLLKSGGVALVLLVLVQCIIEQKALLDGTITRTLLLLQMLMQQLQS